MERLYQGQAAAYDRFREALLHGRGELVARLDLPPGSRLVELGGGTGRNLEFFGDRLRTFERVTLVDLCPSLLAVARERCRRRQWHNVEAVEADATTWSPPDRLPVDGILISYALSMIPDWFRAVDNAVAMLKPGGLLGVVDFYVARKHPPPGHHRHGVVTRSFWRMWFAHHDVFLNPDHLPYLACRTEVVHCSEHRGPLPYVRFLKAPYYIFVGRKES
jgi:S-adenosylmethionine-diacylgycerolhomoserine-N-methlytransferase